MYPARTNSLWLATSASAGASRSVGIKSCDQRCMIMVSNRERILDCKRWVASPHARTVRERCDLKFDKLLEAALGGRAPKDSNKLTLGRDRDLPHHTCKEPATYS